MNKISGYIKKLAAHGEISFSSEMAQEALAISSPALNAQLYRLRKKGDIVTIAKRFHLIIPPEYQIVGCLPPFYFINSLMQHWNKKYYVCLLSAAEYYGAAHQKPQVFQVMTNQQMKPICCGNVKIEFVYKKSLHNALIDLVDKEEGKFYISSPELTAMDLLTYPNRVGGINRIATILTELTELLDPKELINLSKKTNEIAWLQKLGFMLDSIEPVDPKKKDDCVKELKKYIGQRKPQYISLIHGETKSCTKDKNWKIIINTNLESDV